MKLTKDNFAIELGMYIDQIFSLPEVLQVAVRKAVLTRGGDRAEFVWQAVERSYHDCYSDIDLKITVKLPAEGLTAQEYLRHAERFGIGEEQCLGFIPDVENGLYRVVFRNGMRYDIVFLFEYGAGADNAELTAVERMRLPGGEWTGQAGKQHDNPDWPLDKVNSFWFIQIQALGKLYRKDYLIADHLANMNLNETLVMQMILRDQKYGTNHHRYGYEDRVAYADPEYSCPVRHADAAFDRIADKIYRAALACDELLPHFYPEYEERSGDFFGIWREYEAKKVIDPDAASGFTIYLHGQEKRKD